MHPPETSFRADAASHLAVFDFDGTLTTSDTFLAFLRHVAGGARFAAGMTVLAPKLVAFKLGIVKNTQAKEAAIGRFLAGRTEAELRDAAESFARDVIPRLLRDEAMRRLEWHRREGHAVAVASASLELYLRPWTDAAGIEHLAATRIGLDGGRVTGRLLGANCHGPEKVVRLREMFPDLGERIVHAYGDSSGDRELLAIARHAHYRRFPAEAEVG